MREGALFGTMFGLGAGAVLVGVTVSRLVVGQAPERPAAEPPSVAAELRPAVAETPPPAVVSSAVPPPVVAAVVEPPPQPATRRQRRPIVRKHPRPPLQEETPLATASVPSGEPETVLPSPAGADQPPVAVVRSGAARPIAGSRAPGPHIIHVDPPDGER